MYKVILILDQFFLKYKGEKTTFKKPSLIRGKTCFLWRVFSGPYSGIFYVVVNYINVIFCMFSLLCCFLTDERVLLKFCSFCSFTNYKFTKQQTFVLRTMFVFFFWLQFFGFILPNIFRNNQSLLWVFYLSGTRLE